MDPVPTSPSRRKRRPQERQLLCPAHPEQRIAGDDKKCLLHMLKPEGLKARGMFHEADQLVIQVYPVLMLSNEWLEKLSYPQCGSSRWCHLMQLNGVEHSVR